MKANNSKAAKAAKAFKDLERAERRLSTAFTKWAKARARVRRIETKMDKELNELGGELDVRKMPIKARPWPKGRANNVA